METNHRSRYVKRITQYSLFVFFMGGLAAMAEIVVRPTVLFTDYRHIRCDDATWARPDGTKLPLRNPPEPMISNAVPCLNRVPRGIRLVAQPAQLEVPADIGGRTVIYDPQKKKYRAWGMHDRSNNTVRVIYKESTNATEWTVQGDCIVSVPEYKSFDAEWFFIDPKGPPEEQYKAIYSAEASIETDPKLWGEFLESHPRGRDSRINSGFVCYQFGLVSGDGINWRALERPLMVHQSDTLQTAYYDSWLNKYVMYTRLYWQERRMVGRSESDDFRHWTPFVPVIWPNLHYALSDDIYTNCRTDYPGAIGQPDGGFYGSQRITKSFNNLPLPGYHLMFPMIYHRLDQTSDVRIYSSIDGIFWNEVPGGPVVKPGMKGHEAGLLPRLRGNLIPLPGDRIALQYVSNTFPHKYPRWPEIWKDTRIGYAWWPRGRLVAVKADTEGEFWTFKLDVRGDTLCANYRTEPNGAVRIGLYGVDGCSVNDCTPLSGDELSAPLQWKKDPGFKNRDQIELHVKLKKAELFSLEWMNGK